MEEGDDDVKTIDLVTPDTSSDSSIDSDCILVSENLSACTIPDDDGDEVGEFTESLQQFQVVLSNLIRNEKKIIDGITKLAGANYNIANGIVDIISKNKTNVNGLLLLYVIDNILKTVGGDYVVLFSKSLVHTFKNVFEGANADTKRRLFLLRISWKNIFPETTLAYLDDTIHKMDRNWEIAKKPAIHIEGEDQADLVKSIQRREKVDRRSVVHVTGTDNSNLKREEFDQKVKVPGVLAESNQRREKLDRTPVVHVKGTDNNNTKREECHQKVKVPGPLVESNQRREKVDRRSVVHVTGTDNSNLKREEFDQKVKVPGVLAESNQRREKLDRTPVVHVKGTDNNNTKREECHQKVKVPGPLVESNQRREKVDRRSVVHVTGTDNSNLKREEFHQKMKVPGVLAESNQRREKLDRTPVVHVKGTDNNNTKREEYHHKQKSEDIHLNCFHDVEDARVLKTEDPSAKMSTPDIKMKANEHDLLSDDEQEIDKWISSGEYFIIPQDIWQCIFKDNDFVTKSFTYYKNKIGQIFDKTWGCIIVITHKNAGQSRITLRGKCKHQNCKVFSLIWYGDNKNESVTASPPFLVRYNKQEKHHEGVLCRQMRGVTRVELKEGLRHARAKTLNNELLRNMNEELYANGVSTVPSDDTTKKARSEMILANDLCKGDFEDFIALQQATKEDPYIAKVSSPFAVFMHSEVQFKVLAEAHRRRKPGEEIVGRLDATGGVVKVDADTSEKQILYYPLLLRLKGDCNDINFTLCAVTESLNSSHGVPDISAWLNCFNESFMKFKPTILPVFDRIISDFAYANFHGVLHVFQSMRIHEYIFICYKYAVSLTDFEKLRRLVKMQMCTVHLSKTFAQFVRTFFPSLTTISNTTFEQKYLIECLSCMMICKSYCLFKEIFRNLCIILLSKTVTSEVIAAKEAIVVLTDHEKLMTVPEKMQSNFKYDKLTQEEVKLTDCTTVYDLNESILNLPIYKGSLFYSDLFQIYNEFEPKSDVYGDNNQLEKNTLYNGKILPAFMKQFGGILPLWTGFTIPKGIERYDNQSAELQMKNVKQLMQEKQLQIGTGKVKGTRFAKLVREEVLANSKRYLLKVPRRGLNYGRIRKNKDKDDSKISKRIAKSVRERIRRTGAPLRNRKQLKVSFINETVKVMSTQQQSIQQFNSDTENLESGTGEETKRTERTAEAKTGTAQEAKSDIELPTNPKRTTFSEQRREHLSDTKKNDQMEAIFKSLPRRNYGRIRKNRDSSKISKRIAKNIRSKIRTGLRHRKQQEVSSVYETTNVISTQQKSLPKLSIRPNSEAAQRNSDTAEVAERANTEKRDEAESGNERESINNAEQPKEPESSTSQKWKSVAEQRDEMETTLTATESWNKRGSKKSKSRTYFDRKSIVQSIAMPNKPIAAKNSNHIQSKGPTLTSFSSEIFHQNGLFKDAQYYLKNGWSFVVAKRTNSLSSEYGVLKVEDLRSLHSGQISVECMNYIMDFIIPQRHMNLTPFAEGIVAGIDPFKFSIHNRTCFIPHFDKNLHEWALYMINTAKSTLCYIASDMHKANILTAKLQIIGKFIDTYNGSSRHNKLRESSRWTSVTLSNNYFETAPNSGVGVVNYVHRLVNSVGPDPFNSDSFRDTLLSEVLEYSENMANLCLKCGEEDDALSTTTVSWSMCDFCKRWIHDTCFKLEGDRCPVCLGSMSSSPGQFSSTVNN